MGTKMLPGIAVVLTFLAMGGCGSGSQQVTDLQQFDDLGPQLHAVSTRSAVAATDIRQLNASMGKDDAGGARRAARLLRAVGRELASRASKTGYKVRDLTTGDQSHGAQPYLRLTAETLEWQRLEGQALVTLAHISMSDPLLALPGGIERLESVAHRARSYSMLASADAARAALWKLHHRGLLRYIRVRHPVHALRGNAGD